MSLYERGAYSPKRNLCQAEKFSASPETPNSSAPYQNMIPAGGGRFYLCFARFTLVFASPSYQKKSRAEFLPRIISTIPTSTILVKYIGIFICHHKPRWYGTASSGLFRDMTAYLRKAKLGIPSSSLQWSGRLWATNGIYDYHVLGAAAASANLDGAGRLILPDHDCQFGRTLYHLTFFIDHHQYWRCCSSRRY